MAFSSDLLLISEHVRSQINMFKLCQLANTVDPHSLLVAMGTDTTVHMGFLPGTGTICQRVDLEPFYRHMTQHPDATAWIIPVCLHGHPALQSNTMENFAASLWYFLAN